MWMNIKQVFMKSRTILLLLLSVLSVGMLSCKDDDPPGKDELTCSVDSIAFTAEEDAKLLLITTSDEW